MPYIGANVQPLPIPNPPPFKTNYVPANGKLGEADNFSGRGFGEKNCHRLEQLSGEEICDLWRVLSRSVRPELPAQRFPDSRILFSYESNVNLDAQDRGRQFAIPSRLRAGRLCRTQPFQSKIIAFSTPLRMRSQSFCGEILCDEATDGSGHFGIFNRSVIYDA